MKKLIAVLSLLLVFTLGAGASQSPRSTATYQPTLQDVIRDPATTNETKQAISAKLKQLRYHNNPDIARSWGNGLKGLNLDNLDIVVSNLGAIEQQGYYIRVTFLPGFNPKKADSSKIRFELYNKITSI